MRGIPVDRDQDGEISRKLQETLKESASIYEELTGVKVFEEAKTEPMEEPDKGTPEQEPDTNPEPANTDPAPEGQSEQNE